MMFFTGREIRQNDCCARKRPKKIYGNASKIPQTKKRRKGSSKKRLWSRATKATAHHYRFLRIKNGSNTGPPAIQKGGRRSDLAEKTDQSELRKRGRNYLEITG